jgi:hypothetical protein
MRIFAFDPSEYSDQYQSDGWVHVRGGVTPEFFEAAQEFAERQFGEHLVEGRAIAGAKTQALFEFPTETDFPGELFDVVTTACALRRETMTLSERHIKAYNPDADPNPPAHKDRYASKVSMGISLRVPEGSHLVLYPRDHVSVNPFNVSAAFPQSLSPEERPDVALRTAQPVEIYDKPGDVMMFPGSAVWHLRRRPAGAMNLYLKLNDFNSDPLGEDPTSASRRAHTLAALAEEDGSVEDHIIMLGRRMDVVTRRYVRDSWAEVLQADVWGEDPVQLSEVEFRLIQAADARRTVGDLAGDPDTRAALRRLAERGVLELV